MGASLGTRETHGGPSILAPAINEFSQPTVVPIANTTPATAITAPPMPTMTPRKNSILSIVADGRQTVGRPKRGTLRAKLQARTPNAGDSVSAMCHLALGSTVVQNASIRRAERTPSAPACRSKASISRTRRLGHLRPATTSKRRFWLRVKTLKATGAGHLPFQSFQANAAWLELALLAHDILVWTQQLTLDGEHKIAEPKRLRYRILHVAGQITRHARRTTLHLPADWPWAGAILRAFKRLDALPAYG